MQGRLRLRRRIGKAGTGWHTRESPLVENYPQLWSAEGIQVLQEQPSSAENRIAYACQFYNDEVMKYNASQATFPGILFARLAMFAADEAQRANVSVKL